MRLKPLLHSLLLLSPLASANTEKTIFLAPSATILPTIDPSLDDLGLQRLSPSHPVLRTQLNASFPTTDSQGTDSWYFLENLSPGRRYEVRVCWLATQPTSFTLDTYTLSSAIENPSLFSSITLYSTARLSGPMPDPQSPNPRSVEIAPTTDSVLFLRVRAAADYFSTDEALMETVPPVWADIILDPFLGNVFPVSLVRTACYLGAVGVGAVLLSWWVLGALTRIVYASSDGEDNERKVK